MTTPSRIPLSDEMLRLAADGYEFGFREAAGVDDWLDSHSPYVEVSLARSVDGQRFTARRVIDAETVTIAGERLIVDAIDIMRYELTFAVIWQQYHTPGRLS